MVSITRKQVEAIHRKYQQNNDGATSYLDFRRRVEPLIGDNTCCILPRLQIYWIPTKI